jgi:hypothetical protein
MQIAHETRQISGKGFRIRVVRVFRGLQVYLSRSNGPAFTKLRLGRPAFTILLRCATARQEVTARQAPMNGANGMRCEPHLYFIEGKAATGSGERGGSQASFNTNA